MEASMEAGGLIPIFVMGRKFDVPSTLTIQKALEYAGYQLVRGCGCRGGICGACTTVYRKPDNPRVQIGLACQTVVEPNMYLTQIPFFPVNRADYQLEKIRPNGSTVATLYPETFKCVGCNTCTRGCPMDLDVMEYMARAIRGDVAAVAELSFACVMCGTCAARCPGETVPYMVGILCRRLYGKYLAPKSKHLAEQVANIEGGKFEEKMRVLMSKSEEELRKLYQEKRQMEPPEAPEDWEPSDRQYL